MSSCESCENLRTYAPAFVTNGVTKAVCNSLKNNTGLNAGNSRDNETDLNDVNDCLIGRMKDELKSFGVCDWKEYEEKFIPNLHETLKAMLCSDAGQWNNIEEIWCWLRHITTESKVYGIHAYEDDDPSKKPINGFRIADGVVMRPPAPGNAPIRIVTMGNKAYTSGSLSFSGNMPSDYTNGATVPWSYLQHGCSALTNKAGESWGANGVCSTQPLIWEIQFKKCQLGFSAFFGYAWIHQGAGGNFDMRLFLYKKGDTVPPDYSAIQHSDGSYDPGSYVFNPDDDDMLLFQVRLQNTRVPLGDVTPNGNFDIVACPDSWSC